MILNLRHRPVPELRLENSVVDDRYLVDRCLGRGSYAEIFLAYDQLSDGEPVIIKSLNTSLQGTPDPDGLALVIVAGYSGAMTIAKLEQRGEPLRAFSERLSRSLKEFGQFG